MNRSRVYVLEDDLIERVMVIVRAVRERPPVGAPFKYQSLNILCGQAWLEAGAIAVKGHYDHNPERVRAVLMNGEVLARYHGPAQGHVSIVFRQRYYYSLLVNVVPQ